MKKIFFCGCSLVLACIANAQNVGVGTTTPQVKFQVSNGALSGAQYFGISSMIVENPSTFFDGSIQFINPSTRAFAILSGTELASRRSSVSFQPDSSLTFETGNTIAPRMKIDKTGVVTVPNRIGIGNTSPFARLHISNGVLTDAQYFGLSNMIVENSNTLSDASIQLVNPSSRIFSILSGTELASRRGSISFQPDSSVTFETGNTIAQRMKIDKTGVVTVPNRVGIGSTSPLARLHISNGTLPDAQYFGLSNMIVESSSIFADGSVQLVNPSTRAYSILSGTELTSRRSSISFQPDSSVTVETGSTIAQRMKIDKIGTVTVPGRLGIGTSSPVSRFHVSSGELLNAQYFGLSTMTVESANLFANGFIQLVNPSVSGFSIIAGSELNARRSGISFLADSSVTIEAGGIFERIRVRKNGFVGINENDPITTLDVNGGVKLGNNGSILTEVIKGTFTKDVANVPANSSVTEIFTVPNTQVTSTVYISPSVALANGLIIGYARVFPAGNVEVRFTNVTASAINPGTMDFYITVIR